MLMPAAVLIVVILGGIAVDRAVIFGAQRDLVATAQAAANDGVAAAVDLGALRTGVDGSIDRRRLDTAVRAAATRADGEVAVRWYLEDQTLVVVLERDLPLIFSPAIPGVGSRQRIRATARADLIRS